MLPFFGKAHIAYIPRANVVGLSKLSRLLEVYARRMQIQERLTRAAFDANVSVEEIEKIFSEIPEQKRISVKPAEVAFRAAESVPLEELNLLNIQISKTLDGLIELGTQKKIIGFGMIVLKDKEFIKS